ncbi:winged helix-turn-helix transcriptional regulator [Lactiplantibacillus pingfangensis]|uniref:winged helix-turn-helix transcriptional regulator n=1 Tax=Lactiplantibacillus pingfangensis TaxID=2559915 RepID=UPI0010F5F427|nr:helix-turn-helix domain-containing protein [Lactiplantibacillus pingfangensis]
MRDYSFKCEKTCPVAGAARILSGKWNAVLIYKLFQHDVCRFSDFSTSFENLSPRMLALKLAELETANIISKKVYPVIPPKTEYRLTAFGETLKPVIDAMEAWGKYNNHVQDKNRLESASLLPHDDES